MTILTHPWPPISDKHSRILILGSFPSPKSREFGFPYGHPQNIFWATLAGLLDVPVPERSAEATRRFLLRHRIALWDVLHSCEIRGADDASIRNPVPNKFRDLIDGSDITRIFTTGKKATDLFNKLCAEEAGMNAIYLPSTSPANRAAQAKPSFQQAWSQVTDFICSRAPDVGLLID
jgi:hypoxanthine-DNA glycosylase